MNAVKINRISVCISVVFMTLLFSGCATSQKIVYFQDMPAGSEQIVCQPKVIKVQPGDQLFIVVYSDNPEMASAFNLNMASGSGSNMNSSNVDTRAYTVDSRGCVKMPVLGDVCVAGKTREQISEEIENELVERNLLRNPVVNIAFRNLHINVLGETGQTRQISIEKDIITLPEVLSQCGDLTINGLRENVKVIRDVDGKKVAYTVDMRSAQSVYESPAYYLQPNDLVYVAPNKQRSNQSTPNANAALTPAFWISIITFLTSMGVLIFK